MMKKEEILKKLNEIKDPEIGYGIVDLGFISDVKVSKKKIKVKVILTTPLCPHANLLFELIREKLKKFGQVEVEYDWENFWTPERVKPEIRKKLGLD